MKGLMGLGIRSFVELRYVIGFSGCIGRIRFIGFGKIAGFTGHLGRLQFEACTGLRRNMWVTPRIGTLGVYGTSSQSLGSLLRTLWGQFSLGMVRQICFFVASIGGYIMKYGLFIIAILSNQRILDGYNFGFPLWSRKDSRGDLQKMETTAWRRVVSNKQGLNPRVFYARTCVCVCVYMYIYMLSLSLSLSH